MPLTPVPQSMTPAASMSGKPVFAVAPMIDWTDRHYRFLARQLTTHALLYTEMIVSEAILRGDRQRLLGFASVEPPLALQLGGNDPLRMAQAAQVGEAFGYSEINMNVGCPSDRVQSGTFGACLMRTPAVVADCVAAMKVAVRIPVTVKCRIGVDDQDPEEALYDLVSQVRDAGVDGIWVHARKAWLQGLSPKENRDIPPLDYALVHRLKGAYPSMFIGINGGLTTLNQALEHTGIMDGVMLGRAAYHDSGLLTGVDGVFAHPLTGDVPRAASGSVLTPAGHRQDTDFWAGVCDAMMAHASDHIAAGGRLIHVTRHMVGLFQGWPGARRFRQILSAQATQAGAGPQLIADAFSAMLSPAAARQAAE